MHAYGNHTLAYIAIYVTIHIASYIIRFYSIVTSYITMWCKIIRNAGGMFPDLPSHAYWLCNIHKE